MFALPVCFAWSSAQPWLPAQFLFLFSPFLQSMDFVASVETHVYFMYPCCSLGIKVKKPNSCNSTQDVSPTLVRWKASQGTLKGHTNVPNSWFIPNKSYCSFLRIPIDFRGSTLFLECRLPKQGFYKKTGSDKWQFLNWVPLNFWKGTLFMIFSFALFLEMLGSFLPACNP